MFNSKLLCSLLFIAIIVITGCSNDHQASNNNCTKYLLEEKYKLAWDEGPVHCDNGCKSPNTNELLIKIVIDPDDPNMMDEPWRYAYYSESEDIFWISDMPGFSPQWYGPYKGKPCIE